MPRKTHPARRRVEHDPVIALEAVVPAGMLSGDPASPRHVQRHLHCFYDEDGVAWLRDRRMGDWHAITPARAARGRA
ncbi:MAG: hypothetical protein OXC25_07810 [Thiotrichales bacterium]|nr:hypothetical protein [Thiotrichales bacterium]